MIKAAIFDLDGTLADTLETLAYYSNTVLKEQGLAPIDKKEYRYLVGRGALVLQEGMLAFHGITDAERAAKMRLRFEELYLNDTMYLTKLYDGIAGLIEGLNARGIACGVVSNKPDAATQQVIAALFPHGGFGFVTGKQDRWALKPAPDAVLAAAEALSAQPCECLYVGDTCTDMLTGKAAKMFTVGVLWGFRDYKELSENGADAIVSRPDEILTLAETL